MGSAHLFESDGSIPLTAAPSVSSLHGCRACGVNPNGAQSVPKFDAAECEWAVHPLQRASSPHLSIGDKGRNIADDNVELSSSSTSTSAVAEIVNNSGVRHPDGMLERLGPTPIGSLTRESGLSREDGCREAAVMTCRVATSPASVPSSTLSPVQLTVRNGIPASAIFAVAEANSTVGRSSDESDETSTSTTSPTLDMRSIAKSSLKTAIAAREQPPAWSNEINVVDYERRMASHFKQLQRLIDDETAASPCFGSVMDTTVGPSARNETASRTGLLQAALFYNPDRDIDAATSQPPHVNECDTCCTGGNNYTNFAATDAKQLRPNEDTPSVKGNRIHVAVMYEMADGDLIASSSQNTVAMISQTTASPAATLRIPYRSLTANLQVLDNGMLHKIRAVCDSGAAQTAVSARWLRKHPELWDARIEAEHRFHGVTGEPLQTDGVVRLTLCIANHYISVWAHVFVHMHADMLH